MDYFILTQSSHPLPGLGTVKTNYRINLEILALRCPATITGDRENYEVTKPAHLSGLSHLCSFAWMRKLASVCRDYM